MATKKKKINLVEFNDLEQGQFFKLAPVDNRHVHIKDSESESTDLENGKVECYSGLTPVEVVEVEINETQGNTNKG